jgi:hypothetical protein
MRPVQGSVSGSAEGSWGGPTTRAISLTVVGGFVDDVDGAAVEGAGGGELHGGGDVAVVHETEGPGGVFQPASRPANRVSHGRK